MKTLKKNKLFLLYITVFMLVMSLGIGYASVSSIPVEINGSISMTPQEGVYISSIEYLSDHNAEVATSKIKNYIQTTMNSTIALSPSDSTSTITYTVTVYNGNEEDYGFSDIIYDSSFYDNEDIVATTSLIPGELIGPNESKSFTITFSYKGGVTPSTSNNILNSYINFSFKKNHTITYHNITGETNLMENILDGETYSYTFTSPPDLISVTMGETILTKDTDFTYTNGVLTIPNVTDNLTITGEKNTVVKTYILENIDNNNEYKGEIQEGIQYTTPANANDSGLYSITNPNTGNSESLYFFRGNVQDNYVSFAGKTWRILRINGDGSVRLILDGSIGTSRYQSTNVPSTRTIDKAIELLTWENSTVYSTLQTWYTNNLNSYNDYILQNSEYVFDTSYQEKTSSSNSNKAVYYFGSYLRVGKDGALYQPTYAYTSSNVKIDKIGLVSADEVLYAGGFWQQNNTSYFLYNSSITTDWWTMSPSFWDKSSHYKAGMLVISSSGSIHDWPTNGNTLTASLAIRPVITIRGDIPMTGIGTRTNPYQYSN